MATAAQREARRRRRANKRAAQRSTGLVGPASESSVRTVTLTDMMELRYAEKKTTDGFYIKGANLPNLAGYLQHAIEWRVRSCRATFHSTLPQTDSRMLAILMTPKTDGYRPADFLDSKRRGGTVRLARVSGWSSNTLGAQDTWQKTADAGADLFVSLSETPMAAVVLGFAEITVTIQTRGHK